jgi:GNAT superfamily N-acetyltransferase
MSAAGTKDGLMPSTGEVKVRECGPEDSEGALDLRNRVFPPIDAEHWKQSATAAVAYLGSRLIGVIPFEIRDFLIAPGISIAAAFANSVAVDEGYRSRGIGGEMMKAAYEFLPRLAQAVFVYTDNERDGLQYRFYNRCGYHDLLYPRRMRRNERTARESSLTAGEVVSIETALGMQDDLLAVYRACYADCAGSPLRWDGYWAKALASQIFVVVPHEKFAFATVLDGSDLTAYALVGLRGEQAIVLEWAARSESAADGMWHVVGDLARAWSVEESITYAQELTSPFWATLPRAGFTPDARFEVLAGRVLALEDVYLAWWQAVDERSIPIEVWTPQGDVRFGYEESEVILEMKEEALHRLLLGRVDLEGLVRTQWVTVRGGDWARIAKTSTVQRTSPWVYHHLDYI